MKNKIVLVITVVCVIVGLILVFMGFGNNGYVEKITDVKGRGNESYDRILVSTNDNEFAKLCKVSDEEYRIPIGYTLLEIKNNKLKKCITESPYKSVKKDCQYYYIEQKAHPFSCRSSVKYNNETFNYKLSFYIKINDINNVFKNNDFFESTDEEFFDKYMRNILEKNINRILLVAAEKSGKPIKEVSIAGLREELNVIAQNQNLGFEFDMFRIVFD